MEKKDYLNFASRFELVREKEASYRKELDAFIDDAFAMHGNEFVLKPSGEYESWQELVEKEDGIMVENHFSTYFELEDKYGQVQLVYPTRICRIGDKMQIECMDGYDYGEREFVEGLYLDGKLDTLEIVALFIKSVLEQESEAV